MTTSAGPASVRRSRAPVLIAAFFAVLLLALFPWTSEPTGQVKDLILAGFAALVLVAWAFARVGPHWSSIIRDPMVVLWTLFLAMNAIAIFASPNPVYSAVSFTHFSALYIVFITSALAFTDSGAFWTFVRIAASAAVFVSLYGFLQYAGRDPFPWDPAIVEKFDFLKQAPSTLGNPNVASHALVLLIVLAAGLLAHSRNFLWGPALALFLAHFGLTQTRGSVVALVASAVLAACVWLLWRRAKPRGSLIAPLIAASVLLVSILVVVLASVWFRQGSFVPYDDSMRLRYHAFDGAARMVQDSPLLGSGPGSYEIRSPAYWTEHEQRTYAQRAALNDHVHNEVLETAVESGVIGAIVFSAILLFGILRALRLATSGPANLVVGATIAAFFLSFLVDGIFGYNAHVPVSAALLSIVSGALVGLERRSELSSRSAAAIRLFYLAAGVALAAVSVSVFAGEMQLQRGRGAAAAFANDAALDAFSTAAKWMPYNWTAEYLAGQTAITLGDPAKAAGHFGRTVDLHPNFVPGWIGLARTSLTIARSEQGASLQPAKVAAERALTLSPYSPEVYDVAGRIAVVEAGTTNDAAVWNRARELFLRAITLDDSPAPITYELLAQTQGALRDFPGAEASLAAAVEQSETPKDWSPFLQLATQSRRFDALLDAADARIRRLYRENRYDSQAFAAASLAKAGALLNADRTRDAVDSLRYAARQQPANLAVWAAFARIVDPTSEDFTQALEQAAQQLAAVPGVPARIVILAAESLRDRSRLGVVLDEMTAIAHTLAAEKSNAAWAGDTLANQAQHLPENNRVDLSLRLANFFASIDAHAQAIHHFRLAYPLAGRDDQVRCLLGEAASLSELGRHPEALAALERALNVAPNDISVKWTYAETLAKAGRIAEARLEFAALLSLPGLTPDLRAQIDRAIAALPR